MLLHKCVGYFFLVLLAGCAAAAVPVSAPPPVGAVQITTPQTGAILYSPVLYVSGTASSLPQAGFILRAIGTDDRVIGEMPVQPQGDVWAVTLAHTRPAEPTEITLYALPAGGAAGDYDVVSVVLSSEAQRPEGIYGTILTPFAGDTVGGDVILAYGTASGLFDGTLRLALERPDGTRITEQTITVNNPGIIDEVPWTAEIATQDYTGEALIRAYYDDPVTGEEVTLATARVMLVFAAG